MKFPIYDPECIYLRPSLLQIKIAITDTGRRKIGSSLAGIYFLRASRTVTNVARPIASRPNVAGSGTTTSDLATKSGR
jgi:hypothetical protein